MFVSLAAAVGALIILKNDNYNNNINLSTTTAIASKLCSSHKMKFIIVLFNNDYDNIIIIDQWEQLWHETNHLINYVANSQILYSYTFFTIVTTPATGGAVLKMNNMH